jgi:hypothetical protein
VQELKQSWQEQRQALQNFNYANQKYEFNPKTRSFEIKDPSFIDSAMYQIKSAEEKSSVLQREAKDEVKSVEPLRLYSSPRKVRKLQQYLHDLVERARKIIAGSRKG